MQYLLFITMLSLSLFSQELNINILYIEEVIKKPPVLSNIAEEPKDSGLKGAQLAIIDSEKTANFSRKNFILHTVVSKDEKKLILAFEEFINKSKNDAYIILNASDALFTKLLNHPLSKKALIINSANTSTKFRKEMCSKNTFHTIASDAMMYDGLVQFLIKRNWKNWLLIKGTTSQDKKIEKAIKRASKRFGGNIVEEKTWTFNSDIRRRAQSEMPSFTQSKEHDVVLVADFYGDFSQYIYFNTWTPRPLAGSAGLTPVTWNKVIEAWGAAQLQSRFEKFALRWMTSKDYASWVAVRTIVTAVNKTNSQDIVTNRDFMYSDKFEIAAYKGRKLTFRKYNGQLRLPISLIHPKALVSSSPQVGFLHPLTDLDTLGIAPHEMKCN
jgi:ABC transporter substrate binding protein (PQQ-dependent alcohol dehydrogenase system)